MRSIQVIDRLTRKLRPLRAAPEGQFRLKPGSAEPPAFTENGGFDGASFCLLNRRLPFAGETRWRPGDASDLWAYTLHYFRYLWGLPPSQGLALVLDWIEANPPGSEPGWDPYPISLRVREWLEWVLAHPELPADAASRIVTSVAHQVAVLEGRLEYHLLGNHLLENAISLAWAGATLEGPGARGWLTRGAAVLEVQLAEQILADGSHDERSPMYQALLAEALLRLAAVARRSPAPEATRVLAVAGDAGRRLAASLARMVHPDGGYALLNDCALGIAPPWAALAARFGLPEQQPAASWVLRDAGYAGMDRAGAWLVFDSGPLGPDHQPGHGHADTLGFELSLGGERVVTDTGVGGYEPGAGRAHDRSTAAHSTVAVDGCDQAELWGAFRCGRRPAVEPVRQVGEDTLGGGYAMRLARGRTLRHRRQLRMADGALHVLDVLDGKGSHRLAIRVHLAPGVEAVEADGSVDLRVAGRRRARVAGPGLGWRIGESAYHPEFGVTLPRKCLVAEAPFTDSVELTWMVAFS